AHLLELLDRERGLADHLGQHRDAEVQVLDQALHVHVGRLARDVNRDRDALAVGQLVQLLEAVLGGAALERRTGQPGGPGALGNVEDTAGAQHRAQHDGLARLVPVAEQRQAVWQLASLDRQRSVAHWPPSFGSSQPTVRCVSVRYFAATSRTSLVVTARTL